MRCPCCKNDACDGEEHFVFGKDGSEEIPEILYWCDECGWQGEWQEGKGWHIIFDPRKQ